MTKLTDKRELNEKSLHPALFRSVLLATGTRERCAATKLIQATRAVHLEAGRLSV
jgi:hypothetical protein